MNVEGVERTYRHIFCHNFFNIQQIFNLKKSFGKLGLIKCYVYQSMSKVGK